MGEFLLHIPCCLHFYAGSFTRAGFIFIWGLSVTHPVLSSFLCREFHPCWLHFYLGTFCDTSRGGFIFIRGVSLTHPMLTLFLCGGVSFTHPVLPSFMMLGVSLTHPVLSSFLCREFLLHMAGFVLFFIFYLGSFSYTSRAGFRFLSGEFLLHIPC